MKEGRVLDAGTYTPHLEERFNQTIEKGGWIALEWETKTGTARRTVQVTHQRALQELKALRESA